MEGRYSHRPADRGGETAYGIKEAVARANGYTGRMIDLSIEDARRIYKAQYWDILRLDAIAEISVAAAEELFDTGVNCGVGTAGQFLQRALNAFNGVQHTALEGKRFYPDVKVDGVVGPLTVEAFRAFMAWRGLAGEAVLLRALNGLQATRYIAIAEADHSQEAFTFGWFLNRIA